MKKFVLESRIQSGSDLNPDIESIEFRELSLLFNPSVEAAVIGQFHGEIRAVLEDIERINVDNVSVVQGGAGASFPVKTIDHLLVFGHFALQQFYGDLALEHQIERA